MSACLTFHKGDYAFVKNLRELRERPLKDQITHIVVVRSGRANTCGSTPIVYKEHYLEYDGNRVLLSEISVIRVYIR